MGLVPSKITLRGCPVFNAYILSNYHFLTFYYILISSLVIYFWSENKFQESRVFLVC